MILQRSGSIFSAKLVARAHQTVRERVDTYLRDAAPSLALLRAYRDGEVDWSEFAQRYREEIVGSRAHVLDELRALEREHGDIVLLCTERIPPAEHCHRLILIELLE